MRSSWCRAAAFLGGTVVLLSAGLVTAPGGEKDDPEPKIKGEAPKNLPRIPPPGPTAAQVPDGYRVEVVVQGLIYPSAIEFDDKGGMYVAEAGAAFGDPFAPARVTRVTAGPGGSTQSTVVADQLHGPVTGLLWHGGRLYISHKGKVSVLDGPMKVRDLVTDLPSLGDHSNNQLCIGPDGKIYFGVGTATNSGVVGLDSFMMGWLKMHPDFRDTPAKEIKLEAEAFPSPDPITLFTVMKTQTVKTASFAPFGKAGGDEGRTVKGQVKANGAILRMDPDGSNLEVYAWGFRNPFGVCWGTDKRLYASDNGFDERGSRPIANAPDALWRVEEGAWYGWPDYAAGEPVTDAKFKSERGPAPKFLIAEHPGVQKPAARLPVHAGAAGLEVNRTPLFGNPGDLFLALVGDVKPMTGAGKGPAGHEVVRVDPKTGKVEPFFRAAEKALGPPGMEYVATAGPKRPVGLRFSPDGSALYVADAGAIAVIPSAVGPAMRPFPGTGVVWRITRTR